MQQGHRILFLNTLAFTISFACWTLNGVLVTYLIDNGIFQWTTVEAGWLLGIPILTGSIMRLPMGILTDKFGGKPVFSLLLILSSIPLFLLYFVNSYHLYFLLSLLFGMVGTSFAVGVAYTSVSYPKEWQGRALGIFGMGTAGTAITTFLAPSLLNMLSKNNPENGWRMLPVFYGIAILTVGIIFILFAKNKKPASSSRTLAQTLNPLKNIRVWRFGLYYFLVFGLFVTFSQWLLPYYINVYNTSLVMGGVLAACFSLPAGAIRAVGGILSDKFGARKVMYWVLTSSLVISGLLMLPKMEITTLWKGVTASKGGIITSVSDNEIKLNDVPIKVVQKKEIPENKSILPKKTSWQQVIVKENQKVQKKELLAVGKTLIQFEAHIWVYFILVLLIGIMWGIGGAAVFKHIPEYFPNEVGLVGGMVGLIGAMGGFVGPIFFGYFLDYTGLWTSSWIFVFIISAISLYWMNSVIKSLTNKEAPHIKNKFDQ